MANPRNSLQDALAVIARGRLRLTSARRAVAAAGGWLVALLALIVADAMWGLPSALRWAVLAALIGAAVTGMWLLCRLWRHAAAAGSLREAHRIEVEAQLDHHPLVSALQLDHQRGHARDALTRALIARSERRASAALPAFHHALHVERTALRRTGAWLWAVVVLWLVATVIQPGAVTHGLMRIAWPANAQPAMGLTRLEVHIEPREPMRGEDVRVRVQAHGMAPTSAELIELDDEGRSVERWPMSAQGDGAFAHTLRGLREPVTYRAAAGGGRALLEIVPRDPPRAAAAADPEAADDRAAADADVDTDVDTDVDADVGANVDTAAAAVEMLQELAEQARDLATLAQHGEPAPIESAKAAFAHTVHGVTDEASAPALEALADALELPGTDGLDQATSVDAWRETVREAAKADAATLEALAGRIAAGADEAGEQVTTPQGPAADAPVAAGATGDYHQWIDAAQRTGAQPEAFARQVVPEYRELIAAYFRRLSTDDRAAPSGTDDEPEAP